METVTIREKLHSLIDSSSNEELMELYSLFEDDYTDEFKAMLDNEYEDYQQDPEVITKEQLNETIEKLLSGKQ